MADVQLFTVEFLPLSRMLQGFLSHALTFQRTVSYYHLSRSDFRVRQWLFYSESTLDL